MTADVAPLPGLAARIRADAAQVMDDRAATLRFLAESVIDWPDGPLARTHLDLIRGIVAESLQADPDRASNYMAELVELVRETQMLASDPDEYLDSYCGLASTEATEELVSERLEADITWVTARLLNAETQR